MITVYAIVVDGDFLLRELEFGQHGMFHVTPAQELFIHACKDAQIVVFARASPKAKGHVAMAMEK